MSASVYIRNLNRSVEVSDSTRPLLKHIHGCGTDWMHACGGKGRCTTCKAVVLNGLENFSPLSQAELRYRERGLLADNERLACQAFLTGDAEVLVPDENKLPHLTYV